MGLEGILDSCDEVVEIGIGSVGLCSDALVLVLMEGSIFEAAGDVVEVLVVRNASCIEDLAHLEDPDADIFSSLSIEGR